MLAKRILILALTLSCEAALAEGKARLAFVGDMDFVNVGQAGYCGERTSVERGSWQSVYVDGGERVWLRLKSTIRTPDVTYTCNGEYSFQPDSGRAYIVRMVMADRNCNAELFRVVPGGDPVRERMVVEDRQVCLAK